VYLTVKQAAELLALLNTLLIDVRLLTELTQNLPLIVPHRVA